MISASTLGKMAQTSTSQLWAFVIENLCEITTSGYSKSYVRRIMNNKAAGLKIRYERDWCKEAIS